MNIREFSDRVDELLDFGPDVAVTVHTGGHNWEDVEEVIYCQECNQLHIISERIKYTLKTVDFSAGTLNRLKRIQELKGCTEKEALDYAIALGWIHAEKRENTRILNKTLKEKHGGTSS